MKLFASILAFYILNLTANTCIDLPEDTHLQKIEQSQNKTHSHKEPSDHCSPFCACSCCLSPMISQAYIIQFICLSFSQKQITMYTFDYTSTLFSSIWLPPKIS